MATSPGMMTVDSTASGRGEVTCSLHHAAKPLPPPMPATARSLTPPKLPTQSLQLRLQWPLVQAVELELELELELAPDLQLLEAPPQLLGRTLRNSLRHCVSSTTRTTSRSTVMPTLNRGRSCCQSSATNTCVVCTGSCDTTMQAARRGSGSSPSTLPHSQLMSRPGTCGCPIHSWAMSTLH